MLLSNCSFYRGSLSVSWVKPFDLLAPGNENGDWLGVRDDFRNVSFSRFSQGPAEIDKLTISASLPEVCIHCSDTVTFCGCREMYIGLADLKS